MQEDHLRLLRVTHTDSGRLATVSVLLMHWRPWTGPTRQSSSYSSVLADRTRLRPAVRATLGRMAAPPSTRRGSMLATPRAPPRHKIPRHALRSLVANSSSVRGAVGVSCSARPRMLRLARFACPSLARSRSTARRYQTSSVTSLRATLSARPPLTAHLCRPPAGYHRRAGHTSTPPLQRVSSSMSTTGTTTAATKTAFRRRVARRSRPNASTGSVATSSQLSRAVAAYAAAQYRAAHACPITLDCPCAKKQLSALASRRGPRAPWRASRLRVMRGGREHAVSFPRRSGPPSESSLRSAASFSAVRSVSEPEDRPLP
jgi:hypothetical protein